MSINWNDPIQHELDIARERFRRIFLDENGKIVDTGDTGGIRQEEDEPEDPDTPDIRYKDPRNDAVYQWDWVNQTWRKISEGITKTEQWERERAELKRLRNWDNMPTMGAPVISYIEGRKAIRAILNRMEISDARALIRYLSNNNTQPY